MYMPSQFSETDRERIFSLIDRYGFATLISGDADGLQITHAPLQLDRGRGVYGTLIGHVARANPHAAHLVDGAKIVAVFHGPHGYVSPTWYVDESSRDPNVPTWNYVAVHVHGRVGRIDDDDRKWKIVAGLAAQYETGADQPWVPADPAAHAEKLAAIVGFEIQIERIEGKFKLSQNRSVADQQNVVENLEVRVQTDDRAMAVLMRENIARK
jgi:transcriptional regulator